MKNNTKGFTLIELLAVIVILAIIALIATPLVINVINKARKSAAEDSTYGVIKSAELYFTEQLLDQPEGMSAAVEYDFALAAETGGVLPGKDLKFNGTRPTAGKIKIAVDGTITITEALKFGSYNCNLTDGKAVCATA